MSSRRIVILVASLVMAAIAGVLAFGYVSGVKDETAGSAQTAKVLVVKKAVERGATADELLANGTIQPEDRRVVDLPADAVRAAADIRGQKAAIAMQPNEVVTAGKFVSDANLTPSRTSRIEKGNVAIAVSTDKVHGVSNLIEPGDFVNLLVGVPGGTPAASSGSLTPEEFRALVLKNPVSVLYQKVKVLAIDSDLGSPVGYETPSTTPAGGPIDGSQTSTEKTQASTVVFEVPVGATPLIAAAEEAGGLYLTLVRPDYVPVPLPVQTQLSQLPGEAGQTPYAKVPGADGAVGN